jgi:voltage-gated potassium channel Kch
MKKKYSSLSIEEARIIRNRFIAISIATIVTLIIGVVMMRYLEGLETIDALYFSVVSLTTVGYGDFTPETTGGKIFVMGYLLVGIGIVAALLNNILQNAMAKKVLKNNEEKSDD